MKEERNNLLKNLPEFPYELKNGFETILLRSPHLIPKLEKHLKKGGTFNTFLPLMIGRGYGEFWRSKKRYLVVKGSRASKKTVSTARKYIMNMMKYKGSNLLVVRKVGAINRTSTYVELKKAIFDLGVESEWRFTVSPLEIVFIPTGQKILFRGLTY